jgi:anti-sigma regulatory factor (Ser/Thr protein kinase)
MVVGARDGDRWLSESATSGFFDKQQTVDEDFAARVKDVLKRRLSGINASVLLEHAEGVAQRRTEGRVSPSMLVEAIIQASPTFMPAIERVGLAGDLQDLLQQGPVSPTGSKNDRTLSVVKEADLKAVRRLARELCNHHGVDSFVAQKVLAVSSELSRNMLRYGENGRIRVSVNPLRGTLEIRAEDEGPGIVDLPSILRTSAAPRRSLGSGLFGVKRLADEFEIRTGEAGTQITVRFNSIEGG